MDRKYWENSKDHKMMMLLGKFKNGCNELL